MTYHTGMQPLPNKYGGASISHCVTSWSDAGPAVGSDLSVPRLSRQASYSGKRQRDRLFSPRQKDLSPAAARADIFPYNGYICEGIAAGFYLYTLWFKIA